LISKNTSLYKFFDWIDIDKLNWRILSKNINVITILEKNFDKINWDNLSFNKNAQKCIEKNLDKVSWSSLSYNKN
jgi:hypothetical protein